MAHGTEDQLQSGNGGCNPPCHMVVKLQACGCKSLFAHRAGPPALPCLHHGTAAYTCLHGTTLQVLNMKPPEILGLLEEAAGTKMYESKKQAALRTLEKKQVKLDEITKVRGGLEWGRAVGREAAAEGTEPRGWEG